MTRPTRSTYITRASTALAEGDGERFWRRVTKGDGCWSYTGFHDKKGYAIARMPGAGPRALLAHIVAWTLTNGPIPDGVPLDHVKCENKWCVNPDHCAPRRMGEGTETCRRCRETKPVSDFFLDHARSRKLGRPVHRLTCKTCKRALATEYRRRRAPQVNAARRADPDYYRRVVAGTYGLLWDEYLELEEAQQGRCYVCQQPCVQSPRLCIDHDHATGKVRKLLCHRCNVILGRVDDEPALLRQLAAYIEQHRDAPTVP